MATTVSELQVLVSADTSPAEKTLAAFGRSIGSGFGIGVGLKAFELAWEGVTGAIGASVGAASDFESAMSGIKAVTGASASQMADLSATAKQLGADTSFSAKEAADGISELAKAGVSVADIMGGAAKASLDLAAAGGIEVADAANLAAQAMNLFNKSGSEMESVANTIAGAANASAIDVNQFKFSLSSVGAVAAQVGLSFEDTATAIAELGQAGIVGSDAGTSLRTMLLRLQPQTKEQTKLMQSLGLLTEKGGNAFFDASGKVKSMSEISKILQNALKGQTDQQKQATLATLFGSDAIRAAAVFAKNGAEGFDAMAESIGKVTAASVAEERLNNLAGSLEKLKGSLSTVAIEIGQAFLPILKRVVDAAIDVVNAWLPTIKLWAERVPAAIDATVTQMVDYLRPAMTWLTQTGWPLLQAAAETFRAYIAGVMMPALQAFWNMVSPTLQAALTWLTTTGFPLLQSAMAVYATWLQTVMIPTITGVWSWLWEKLSPAVGWFTATGWPALQAAAAAVEQWISGTLVPTLTSWYGWLQDKLHPIYEWFISTGWPALQSAANAVQNWIADKLVPTLTSWYQWLDDKLRPIYETFISTLWPKMQAAGAAVWTWLTGTLFPALREWWEWLQDRLAPVYTWFITYAWPTLQSAGAAVATWLSGTLFPVLSEWWDWLQARLAPIYSWFITYAWPTIKSAGQTFLDWVEGPFLDALAEWWGWMADKLHSAADWWIDYGYPKLTSGSKDWATAIAGDIVPWLSTLNSELAKTDAAESWVTILENIAKFGKFIIEKLDLGKWFAGVSSGARDARPNVGYIAEAIAWISRTLAKWSKLLPGVEVPEIEAPPTAPSGGGGGGGGGSWTVGELPGRSTNPPAGGGGGGGAPPVISPPPAAPPSPSPVTPPPSPAPVTPPGGSQFPPGSDAAPWASQIMAASAATGVPPAVIAAIMDIESDGREWVQSPMNRDRNGVPIGRAQGLMQVMPFHFGVKLLASGEATADDQAFMREPSRNVNKGASILASEFARHGTWRQAAMYYFGIGTDAGGQTTSGYVKMFSDALKLYGGANLPDLADGGIVRARRGGIYARLGEGGRDEAVIPLPRDWRSSMPDHVVLDVAIDGRTAERIYITGRDIALRRGRSTAGVGTTGNLLAGAPA